VEIKFEISKLDGFIKKSKNIVLIGHFNPDGDSIGSIVGFYHYLESIGVKSSLVIPSRYPSSLEFLNPENEDILVYEDDKERVEYLISVSDLIICLDFNKISRTEFLEKLIFESNASKVLIDHHPSPQIDFFDIVISTTEISSTCELLFWILMKMPEISNNVDKLSLSCVQALYVGMLTDTNNFSNSVFPSTFDMSSKIINRGVNNDLIQGLVFNVYSEKRMRLMGHMLDSRMNLLPELGAAFLLLSKDDKKKYDFCPGDSEGFVNLPLSIKGVVISALFSETEDYVRVSLRSKGDYDVNDLSNKYFNGGGHKNASGGRLYIPFSKIPEYFEKSLKEYLKK